jgi:hypothetical protein
VATEGKTSGKLWMEERHRETLDRPLYMAAGDSLQVNFKEYDARTGELISETELDPVDVDETIDVEQIVIFKFNNNLLGLKKGLGTIFGEIAER